MNKNLGLILVLFIILNGCGNLYAQTTQVSCYDWQYNCEFKSGRFIINNATEFKEMSSCRIPKFDFRNYTIIGVAGSSPGHFVPRVDLRIIKNDFERKITIEVTLSGGKLCEACRVMKPSYRRVIYASKFNADYRIEYKYIKIDG